MRFSSINIKFLSFTITALSIIILYGCERLTIPVNDNNLIPPAVPSGLSLYYASDGVVILHWFENKDPDILGYNIYRRINKTNFELISFTANNYFYDDSLGYGENYYYKISAVNTSKMESYPTDSVLAQPINRYKPAQPRYLSINARNWQGNLSVYLRWQPNYEYDIKQYNIYRGMTADFTVSGSSYVGSTSNFFFEDKTPLQIGITYFYKITAVDNGDLISVPSEPANDIIYPIAGMLSPANGSQIDYLPIFKIKTLPYPAVYKIIVQSNEYSGEIWSQTIQSDLLNDTLSVDFYYYGLDYGTSYYWRVLTYSPNGSEVNSISNFYSFILKPQNGY